MTIATKSFENAAKFSFDNHIKELK